MAIFLLSTSIISRNKGRSAVAAAAYRSGEKLYNEYTGITYDFRRKQWIEHTEICLPLNAPERFKDRSVLWNEIEMTEKTKRSRLAREFTIGLPIEMTPEQRLKLVHEFVTHLTNDGMVADICIHNPPKINDRHQPVDAEGNPTKDPEKMIFQNPHVHILTTLRPLNQDGKWQYKNKKEYLCVLEGSEAKDREERGFTAEEFKEAEKEGWQKQYKYKRNGETVYLTTVEAEALGLERIDRFPKSTPYGRENPISKKWNSKEQLYEWRSLWADIANREYERMQSDIRISEKSYKEQGIDKVPQVHMGVSATNMERRNERLLREGKSEEDIVRTDVYELNKSIKEYNTLSESIKKLFKETTERVTDTLKKAAGKLETLRAKAIGYLYEEGIVKQKKGYLQESARYQKERNNKYIMEISITEDAIRRCKEEIKQIEVSSKGTRISKRSNITKRKKEREATLESLELHLNEVRRRYNDTDSSDKQTPSIKPKDSERALEEADNALYKLEYLKRSANEEYTDIISTIPTEEMDILQKERELLRPNTMKSIESSLKDIHGEAYSSDRFDSAVIQADSMLEGSKRAIRVSEERERGRLR